MNSKTIETWRKEGKCIRCGQERDSMFTQTCTKCLAKGRRTLSKHRYIKMDKEPDSEYMPPNPNIDWAGNHLDICAALGYYDLRVRTMTEKERELYELGGTYVTFSSARMPEKICSGMEDSDE